MLTGVSIGPTGLIEGCALEVAQIKRDLDAEIEVWADVQEATSRVIVGDIAWAANEAVKFEGADKLIVICDSGVTDALIDIAKLRIEIGDQYPVLVGGRVSLSALMVSNTSSLNIWSVVRGVVDKAIARFE